MKRSLSTEQIPVLICRDRTGNTSDFVVEKADKEHIGAALKPLLTSDAILCADSGRDLGAAVRVVVSPTTQSIWLRVFGLSARSTTFRM